jgi:ribose transport system ATP-binding protein
LFFDGFATTGRAGEQALHRDVGTALVVVSTDFEEVATVCSRVLVFRNGLIANELRGADITVQHLLACAAGGGETAEERELEAST